MLGLKLIDVSKIGPWQLQASTWSKHVVAYRNELLFTTDLKTKAVEN